MFSSFQFFEVALEAQGYIAMSPDIALHGWLAYRDMQSRTRGLSAMLLDGPPGTGKSFFAECMASACGAERIGFQFVPGTRREDLLYDLDIAQIVRGMAGESLPEHFDDLTSPGVLVRAALASQDHFVILHLDELDKASEKIDAFLLEFLQEGYLNLPHIGQVTANTNNLLVIITKNDQRLITAPLLRRMRSVYIRYPSPIIEQQILVDAVPDIGIERIKALVTVANKLRQKRDLMLHVPSTPELIQCLKDLAIVPPDLAGHVVESWLIRHPEDRSHLKETVNELAGTFKQRGA